MGHDTEALGLVVLAVVIFSAAGLVGRIPLVALSGVLLVTAYRMVERHTVRAVLRSTRGDALVFLKKYADGTVPGCMGLVFLAAGLGMMVLFSRLATTSDKKTWLPILFGFVFAAAGFGVLNLGIRTVLRKSASGRSPD